ncbi:hypothetical protein JCM17823_27880 [Halorubrum gandharaense]
MNRSRFVQLAVVAFGLVFASFFVRGTVRLFFPYDIAVLASAPLLLAAAALVVALFVLGVLDVAGIYELEA